jgi:hypothetical protein
MLHVAAARTACVPQRLLVGNTIAIAVAIDVEVVGIRLADDDAVIERQHDARKQQVVREHRVFIEHTIAVRVFVTRDAAHRLLLTRGVKVDHVRAHLGDVHPPVAIERNHHRLGDVRLGQYRLESITARHFHRRHRRFRRQRLRGR